MTVMTKAILGLVLFSVALTAACGSSDGTVSCAKTDRSGAYVAHFTERAGGTCGPVTDTVLRFDPSAMQTNGCQNTAPDAWSDGDCKLSRSIQCSIAGTTETLTAVATTTETESGGAKLAGVESATIYDGSGAFLCTSTYDLSATRQ